MTKTELYHFKIIKLLYRAWLIQPIIWPISKYRAYLTEGGSAGLLDCDLKSKWCAPSGITTATTDAETSSSRLSRCNGSSNPLEKTMLEAERKFFLNIWPIRSITHHSNPKFAYSTLFASLRYRRAWKTCHSHRSARTLHSTRCIFDSPKLWRRCQESCHLSNQHSSYYIMTLD